MALVATFGRAEAASCTASDCRGTKISTLYISQSGAIYVEPADGGVTNLNCTAPSSKYLTLPTSHAGFDTIYKALLAAYLGKVDVWLRVVAGSSNCEIAYMVLEE